MILVYQILYGLMALFMLWSVYEQKGFYDKIAMAVLALPFILRALRIK